MVATGAGSAFGATLGWSWLIGPANLELGIGAQLATASAHAIGADGSTAADTASGSESRPISPPASRSEAVMTGNHRTAGSSVRAFATLLLGALAGCMVVPTTVTGFRSVGTATTLARGPAGPLSLQIRFRRSSVVVSAVRPRGCQRNIYTIVDITRATQAKLVTSDLDPHTNDLTTEVAGPIIMALLSPATVVVSGILTEAVVHLSRPVTTRTTKLDQEIELDCSVPVAGVPLHALLPSGATVDGLTDDRGVCELVIPDGEPVGLLTVWSAEENAVHTVLYMRPSTSSETPTAPTKIDVDLGAAPPDGVREVRIDPRVVPLDRLRGSNHVSLELRGPAQAIAAYQDALADLLRGAQISVDHWSVAGTGGTTVHVVFTVD
jgi:hypothetical protein